MISRLAGILLLGTCLFVVYEFESQSSLEGVYRLLHWPALVLTGLGPVALTLICFEDETLARALGILFGAGPKTRLRLHEKEALFLHRLGKEYYSEGSGVFEKVKTGKFSPYVRKSIDKLSVKMPPCDIRDLLNLEKDRFLNRTEHCLAVTSMGLRLAPSLGMLGTILGMVRLLSTLEDPSKIGSNMSLALLTTFYGLFFSICIWTPIQQKVERVLSIEGEAYDQLMKWLELIEKRKPTNYFAEAAEINHPQSSTPPQAA